MKDDLIHGIRVKAYALPESIGFDRFTVAFPTQTNDGHSGAMLGRHLGKRIPFAELPAHLQEIAKADCMAYAQADKAAKELTA